MEESLVADLVVTSGPEILEKALLLIIAKFVFYRTSCSLVLRNWSFLASKIPGGRLFLNCSDYGSCVRYYQ
jgi:hypothetical protein